jgi:hypothetical protein
MTEAEKRSKDAQPIVACAPQRHEVSLLTGNASTDAAGARKATKTYTFDQIFDAKATQQDVYDAAVQPLVEEVMEGFNCTVFAYGQVLPRSVTLKNMWPMGIEQSDDFCSFTFAFLNRYFHAVAQTGTGKTHTMEGALAEEDTARPEAGIIPRACNTIFDRLDAVWLVLSTLDRQRSFVHMLVIFDSNLPIMY